MVVGAAQGGDRCRPASVPAREGAGHRRRRPAGTDLVARAGRAPAPRRSWPPGPTPTSTSPTAMRCSSPFDRVVGPSWSFHAAAWTAVDACESDPDRAFAVNALGARHVAEAAAAAGAHLVHVSTDYVFDGAAPRARTPSGTDPPRSRSTAGPSSAASTRCRPACPGRRSCAPPGSAAATAPTWSRRSCAWRPRAAPLRFVDDQRGCPTFTDDLAGVLYDLAVGRRPGLFHVTNQGPTTWYRFARDVVAAAGGDPAHGPTDHTATSSTPPRRPPARPTRCSTTPPCGLSGLPLLADHHEPLERTVKALVAGH